MPVLVALGMVVVYRAMALLAARRGVRPALHVATLLRPVLASGWRGGSRTPSPARTNPRVRTRWCAQQSASQLLPRRRSGAYLERMASRSFPQRVAWAVEQQAGARSRCRARLAGCGVLDVARWSLGGDVRPGQRRADRERLPLVVTSLLSAGWILSGLCEVAPRPGAASVSLRPRGPMSSPVSGLDGVPGVGDGEHESLDDALSVRKAAMPGGIATAKTTKQSRTRQWRPEPRGSCCSDDADSEGDSHRGGGRAPSAGAPRPGRTALGAAMAGARGQRWPSSGHRTRRGSRSQGLPSGRG